MLNLLLNPSILALAALVLAIVWMLRDETDKSRPLLVMALVVNLFYGWILIFAMGRENSIVPWKYDHVLLHLDDVLGLSGISIATALQGAWRIPLIVVYQLMVPMMIAWFVVVRRPDRQRKLIAAYIVEMILGPALYAIVPACGPVYAFRAAWLHPPAVAPTTIRLSGMPNAFPSLHVGTAFILLLVARGRWPRIIAVLFLAATILATLGTGEHYAIDLVAGFAFGAFAVSVGSRAWKRAALLFALVITWSLTVRFGFHALLDHPAALRAFALLTVGAAALVLAMEWQSPAQPASAQAPLQPASLSRDN